jgi:hypothetical protein
VTPTLSVFLSFRKFSYTSSMYKNDIARPSLWRRKLNLKATFESGSSYLSVKRLLPGALNLGLIGSTCTASPRTRSRTRARQAPSPNLPTAPDCSGASRNRKQNRSKIKKMFIFWFQALRSRRFQRGVDRVNLHRSTRYNIALVHGSSAPTFLSVVARVEIEANLESGLSCIPVSNTKKIRRYQHGFRPLSSCTAPPDDTLRAGVELRSAATQIECESKIRKRIIIF